MIAPAARMGLGAMRATAPRLINVQGSAISMRKTPFLALAAVSAFALSAQAQMKDVTIAVIGPITGKEAPFGAQM
jgi:hypothetical protein